MAALVLAALAACHRAPPRGTPAEAKLAVFGIQNASGGPAPIRRMTDALDAALALEMGARGGRVVPRGEVDAVLARYRLRFTGGVDRQTAKVLREELGVDAVLVATLDQYTAPAPPKVSLAVRLVATAERPIVLWADAVSRSGDDAPGLLLRNVVADVAEMERKVVADAARAVGERMTSGAPGAGCGAPGRFVPRRVFRAPVLDDVGRRTIAVLPFGNETSRRGAGEVLANQFVAQLARSSSFEVLDPGVVREELLRHHIVLEGGVSVDQSMALLDELHADFVLSGRVLVHEAQAGTHGSPTIEFTAYVIDRESAQLVWSSTSDGAGDDGVFFFGAGRVHTASALSCRMVGGVVERIVGGRWPLTASRYADSELPQTLRPPWYGRTSRARERDEDGDTSPGSAGSGGHVP